MNDHSFSCEVTVEMPRCGIYRTTQPLPGKAQVVGAGILVRFHNHSRQGPPIVLLPKVNANNRWTFHEEGYLVDGPESEAFLQSMTRLRPEGFYVTTGPVGLGQDGQLQARHLVQVGYDRGARLIVFPAQPQGNGFWFRDRGFRFDSDKVVESLRPAGFEIRAQLGEEVLLH